MVTTNTWWNQEIIRNHIDSISINHRLKNAGTSVKASPEPDGGSDHNPLISNIKIRIKTMKAKKAERKQRLSKLENIDFRKNLEKNKRKHK